jgi:hypothetical protein
MVKKKQGNKRKKANFAQLRWEKAQLFKTENLKYGMIITFSKKDLCITGASQNNFIYFSGMYTLKNTPPPHTRGEGYESDVIEGRILKAERERRILK